MRYSTTGSTQLPAPDHRRLAQPVPTSVKDNMVNILFRRGPFTPLRTWQNHETRSPDYKLMNDFLHST